MIITVLQTVVAILLIVVILLQARGSGISATFGGSGEFYRSRRSIERVLVAVTILLSVLFAAFSLMLFFR